MERRTQKTKNVYSKVQIARIFRTSMRRFNFERAELRACTRKEFARLSHSGREKKRARAQRNKRNAWRGLSSGNCPAVVGQLQGFFPFFLGAHRRVIVELPSQHSPLLSDAGSFTFLLLVPRRRISYKYDYFSALNNTNLTFANKRFEA